MTHRDQHCIDQLSLDNLPEDSQSASDALGAAGWKPAKAPSETYLLKAHHNATLSLLEQSAQWSRYALSSDSFNTPRLTALLAQNAAIRFPAKFISGPDDQVICVVDVPIEALSQPGGHPEHLVHGSSCWGDWSRGLTAVLSGKGCRLHHAPLDQVAQSLGQLGWAATVEEQSLEVHLQLANVYRRLRIEPHDLGFRVSADLIPLDELSSQSARAVRQLSLEANRRLPFVRFSEDVMSDPPQLLAEVFINVELVSGVWLAQALNAVEAAVVTTSRELLALRDPELAQIYLADN